MTSNILTDMRDIMEDNNIEPNIIEHVIDEVAALWSGINVYVPKRHCREKEKLKTAIYRDYQNGASINQLIKKYKLIQAWIYKIIKDHKEADLQPQKAYKWHGIQGKLQPQITAKIYRTFVTIKPICGE